MKTFCLVLALSLTLPGCSRFTKSGRIDRAYYQQLKQVKAAREKRRTRLIEEQQSEMRRFQTPKSENP
jgi:predicted DNA-binding ribbon-helix-helix protein